MPQATPKRPGGLATVHTIRVAAGHGPTIHRHRVLRAATGVALAEIARSRQKSTFAPRFRSIRLLGHPGNRDEFDIPTLGPRRWPGRVGRGYASLQTPWTG